MKSVRHTAVFLLFLFPTFVWSQASHACRNPLASMAAKIGLIDVRTLKVARQDLAIHNAEYDDLLASPPAWVPDGHTLSRPYVEYRKLLEQVSRAIERDQNRLARLGDGYYVKRLLSKYVGEEAGLAMDLQQRHEGTQTVYFGSEAKLSRYELKVDSQGRLITSDGKPFSTSRLLDKRASFVMTGDGRIYAFSNQFPPPPDTNGGPIYRHSTLLKGLPAAAAGELFAVNGRLTLINRASGHYAPSHFYLKQFITELAKRGVYGSAAVPTERGY